MNIDNWFASTFRSNVSPVTYILFVFMAIRGALLSFNIIATDVVNSLYVVPTLLLMVGALITVAGFKRESERIVAWGSSITFLCEIYAVILWLQGGDLITGLTVSLPLALASAYVYWTNSLGTLWSYTPKSK